jgi:hypothetical protein
VILTTHVPNHISTISSHIIGISLFTIGNNTFFQLLSSFLYLLSFGLTTTATSQSRVSGLVVATTSSKSDHATK